MHKVLQVNVISASSQFDRPTELEMPIITFYNINQCCLCLFPCHAILDPEFFYPDILMDHWSHVALLFFAPDVYHFALFFAKFHSYEFFHIWPYSPYPVLS